jgi:endonuclease/exonuclease/phosphatase family metal-dependent hydrolase
MLEFFEFIFDKGIMDIPRVGGNFMWSNDQDSLSWSIIDRFLLSCDWEAQFLDVSKRRVSRILSDHFSLLLDCGVVVKSSR